MTWGRYWRPCARFQVAGVTWETFDGDGLTIEWSARREVTPTPDTAAISIYNPAPEKARAVETEWRLRQRAPVAALGELSIGWDGETRRLMLGDVSRVVYGPQGPDRILTVEMGDGLRAHEVATAGRQASGATLAQALIALITLPATVDGTGIGGLGYSLPAPSRAAIEAAAGGQVPYRGLPVGRPTAEIVRVLLDGLGLSGRVQNGEFWVMRGQVINRPGPILRPSTGLLEFRPRDDGGAEIRALGDPRAEPGIQIQAQDDIGAPLGLPVYRVERVEFSGSTFEGRSEMAISAAPGVGVTL